MSLSNFAECSRFLGAAAKPTLVSGTVTKVVLGRTKGGRGKTGLRVSWLWLGREVVKILTLRSVQAGEPPASAPSAEAEWLERGSSVTQESQPDGGGASGAGALREPSVAAPPPPLGPPFGATPYLTIHAGSRSQIPRASAFGPAGATAHGYVWKEGAATEPVGGPVSRQWWLVRTPAEEVIQEEGDTMGSGASWTAYGYFMAKFPMEQLVRMVRMTSIKLRARGAQSTTARKVLKFIGVTLLATRYEFCSRADLWSTKARNKYMRAPAFGQHTGLSRPRYDALSSCVTFSEQAAGEATSEKRRWELIDDFVASINLHRAARVTPMDFISVDESMCKWYGRGGHRISKVLPMYVEIDRKPENGCGIQNAACGRNGSTLSLSVVTTAKHQRATNDREHDGLPHGTVILMRLVAAWVGSRRIVFADSYFASVITAVQLLRMGLRLIGVVKTSTRGYPMRALSVIPLGQRGEHRL